MVLGRSVKIALASIHRWLNARIFRAHLPELAIVMFWLNVTTEYFPTILVQRVGERQEHQLRQTSLVELIKLRFFVFNVVLQQSNLFQMFRC
uniref:Uncharacterized protein n=1 Tax=Anopheles quadriannulatus TaxID=34691 RepID=A0A182XTX1_ANOQN